MALWILREPTPQDPLLLLVHLQDTPETGKGKATENCGYNLVGYEQGSPCKTQSYDKPYPPALLS